MKQLTKLKIKHYLYFLIMWLFLIAVIVIVFLLPTEATFKTILITDSYKPVFIISNNDVYKIQKHQKITIKVNNDFFYGKIKSIQYDNQKKIYRAETTTLPLEMVPGSILEAKIIYDKSYLYQKILFY